MKADGTLWGAGDNASGQVGDGSPLDTNLVQIGTDSDWAYVDNGDLHTVAIKTDGSVYAWGTNAQGQLCTNGALTTFNTPQLVTSSVKFIKVSTDYHRTLLLSEDGEIYGCGTNTDGSLGIGVLDSVTMTPTKVTTGTDWVDIEAGETFSMALNSSGDLYTWGNNESGSVGSQDAGAYQLTPYKIGTGYTNIYAGSMHAIAVKGSALLSWGGWNNKGQVGGDGSLVNRLSPYMLSFYSQFDLTPASGQAQISMGAEHSVYTLNGNGALFAGDASDGESGIDPATMSGDTSLESPTPIPLIDLGLDIQTPLGVSRVSVGKDHTALIGADETLYYTGYRESGMAILIELGSNQSQVSSGYEHLVGIDAVGRLVGMGSGALGQLGPVDPVYQENLTVIDGGQWAGAYAGAYTSFGIDDNGSLHGLGQNDFGQVGVGEVSTRVINVSLIDDTHSWIFISAGFNHTLGLQADGSLWAWGGNNSSGQLGNGTTTLSDVPTLIGSDAWISVAAGKTHSLGVKADGTLWAWGGTIPITNWGTQGHLPAVRLYR